MPQRLSVHTLLQSLSGDSTLIVSMLYSIAPEQHEQFVDLFVNLLLRGSEISLDAASDVIAEILMLELDSAAWLHRDFHLFMRGQTHITEIVETLARRTVTAPDGVLVAELSSICKALCDRASSAEDGATAAEGSPATAAMSAANDSHRGAHSPGAWTEEGTATDAFNRFSTSELQGLAAAEQQFLLEQGGGSFPALDTPASASLNHMGLPSGPAWSDAGGLSQSFDGPPLFVPSAKTHAPLRTPLPNGVVSPSANGGAGVSAVAAAELVTVLRNGSLASHTGSTGTRLGGGPSRLRVGWTGRAQTLLLAGLDYFNDLLLAGGEALDPSTPSHAATEDVTLTYVSVIFSFLCDVMDLFVETVDHWPLALRRGLWLLREAVAPPPFMEETERKRTSHGTAPAGPSAAALEGNPLRPVTEGGSSPAAVEEYQPKHNTIATVASLRVLCPILLSMPAYILPVEEDVFGPAYLITRKRVTLVAKLLQKASGGHLYDAQRERTYAPFNSILPDLTRRWLAFFDALTDCGFEKSSFWAQPEPAKPLSGFAAAADSDLVLRFLEVMDQTFVQYQHIALLVRPFTESLHFSQWMRLTQHLYRARMGRINSRALMALPSPSPSPVVTPMTASPTRSGAVTPSSAGATSPATATSGCAAGPSAEPGSNVGRAGSGGGALGGAALRRKSPLHFFVSPEATHGHGLSATTSESGHSTPAGTNSALPTGSAPTGLPATQAGLAAAALLAAPATDARRGLHAPTRAASVADLFATAETATEAFEEVLLYVRRALLAAEEENMAAARRRKANAASAAAAAPLLSATASAPKRTASPTPALLRNYCSVVGMASDGAATLIVYGDLLFCYLTNFFTREKEHMEQWHRQCPRFAAHRSRTLAKMKSGGALGGEAHRDGDAVAMLYFLIHLAVTQNIRSQSFYLIFIHDNTRTHFSLGISWLQDMIALMPVPYQLACVQIVLVKRKRNSLPSITNLYKSAVGAATGTSDFALAAGAGGGLQATGGAPASATPSISHGSERRLPPPVVRVTQVQELPKALPFIATYLPLPMFEYQILMKERKRERATGRSTAALPMTGGPQIPAYGTLVSPASPILLRPVPVAPSAAAATRPRRKFGHVSVPFDQIDHEQRLLSDLPASRRYLHERWARPLCCWQALRASGVWMLHFSQSFFEVLCSATCRRSYADGQLYPLAGIHMSQLGSFAVFLVDFFATFTAKSLKYIGQEPKWLRESVLVTNGPVTASTSDVQVQIPADVKLSNPEEDRFHSTWLYLGHSKAKEKDWQLFESTFQRLIFISTEVDAIEEGRGWDQIVSTRWGLDIYRSRGSGGGFADPASSDTKTAAPAVSSRFVPSLRQVPLRSLLRLILYNVQQMCAIIRESTPEVCPFTKMAAAVAGVRVGLAAAAAAGHRPGAAHHSSSSGRSSTVAVVPPRRFASPEPGVPPTKRSPRSALPATAFTCDEVVTAVAAHALAKCLDAEISVVRLVTSIAAYLRNMHTVHLSDTSAVGCERCVPLVELDGIVKRGVAELIYSRPPESLGEQRVVELIACRGKELMQMACLPNDESCSWHPYSRLWYSA